MAVSGSCVVEEPQHPSLAFQCCAKPTGWYFPSEASELNLNFELLALF